MLKRARWKRSVTGIIVCASAVLMALAGDGFQSVAAEKSPEKSNAKVARFSLPNHYGQLGVTEDQRKTLIDIHNRFEPRFEELEEQIRQLKEERYQKMGEVLTPGQRLRLQELLAESEAKLRKQPKTGEPAKE
ncbi:hypothetical protein SH668x_000240 [Planctomicrobium sp. SH668]|uniref:hypothetical protein n=1 Tax=Planctomicrobium sp. SH668 TaxID=3448126 RepID=UPI003F5B7DD8